MSCNNCTTTCQIHPCYETIWVAKATANEVYLVEITNIGSGRIVKEQVTANAAGYVKLQGGTWNDFFNSGSEFQIKLYVVDYSVVPHVATNIDVDFYVFTGFTGQYYNLSPTFSTTLYDCILFSTEMLYDGEGAPIEIDNQYLTNEDA
jgi:hypothetical protein